MIKRFCDICGAQVWSGDSIQIGEASAFDSLRLYEDVCEACVTEVLEVIDDIILKSELEKVGN